MRIFCVYPGLNKEVNDVAQLIIYLKRRGNDVSVVTARRGGPEKGAGQSPAYEAMEGVNIYRLYDTFFQMIWFPEMFFQRVLKTARQFSPDIVFCSQEFNMRVAAKLKKKLKVPVVMLVEFASDIASGRSRGIVSKFLWQGLGIPYGRAYWRWLNKWAEAIITCNPKDRRILDRLSLLGTPVYYIPWCNQLPGDFSPAKERVSYRATYVGSFSKFKNTEEFRQTIPIIMTRTTTKEFVFVGGGDTKVIQNLRDRYGSAIKHVVGMSRRQALELLSSCAYAYTPVRKGGWGFIGDSWATKTPLVITHNEYCARGSIDSIVIPSAQIDKGINTLVGDANLYASLQENGFTHYLKEHSAAAVGERLIQIMESVKC